MVSKYHYLLHLQFLGTGYHGWAKQLEVKTIQGTLEKTITYVLGHNNFKTLGAGRTDAHVSAHHMLLELFIDEQLELSTFQMKLNKNLPGAIKVTKMEEVDDRFNIIQSPKIKIYHYYFSFGEKPHPYSSAFINNFQESLDIQEMQQAAPIFEGVNYFGNYTKNYSPKAQLIREVTYSRISENKNMTASFFPAKTYIYEVHGPGFLRYQIRMMMGRLVEFGAGRIKINDIINSLKEKDFLQSPVVPAEGLHLQEISL